MSCIHYKLVTNLNYEKLTFDGVNLSVSELKKLVIERKFKRTNSKHLDVDLEVTNSDTNETYKDTDLIPKNSRVYLKRILRNVQPVKSLSINESITSIHQLNTHKSNDSGIGNDLEATSIKNDNISSIDVTNKVVIQNDNVKIEAKSDQKEGFPSELVCPLGNDHLMVNAILVPCCGYFICCEKCIRSKLDSGQIHSLECINENCLQEITSTKGITPYNPVRNAIKEYLLKSQPDNQSHNDTNQSSPSTHDKSPQLDNISVIMNKNSQDDTSSSLSSSYTKPATLVTPLQTIPSVTQPVYTYPYHNMSYSQMINPQRNPNLRTLVDPNPTQVDYTPMNYYTMSSYTTPHTQMYQYTQNSYYDQYQQFYPPQQQTAYNQVTSSSSSVKRRKSSATSSPSPPPPRRSSHTRRREHRSRTRSRSSSRHRHHYRRRSRSNTIRRRKHSRSRSRSRDLNRRRSSYRKSSRDKRSRKRTKSPSKLKKEVIPPNPTIPTPPPPLPPSQHKQQQNDVEHKKEESRVSSKASSTNLLDENDDSLINKNKKLSITQVFKSNGEIKSSSQKSATNTIRIPIILKKDLLSKTEAISEDDCDEVGENDEITKKRRVFAVKSQDVKVKLTNHEETKQEQVSANVIKKAATKRRVYLNPIEELQKKISTNPSTAS